MVADGFSRDLRQVNGTWNRLLTRVHESLATPFIPGRYGWAAGNGVEYHISYRYRYHYRSTTTRDCTATAVMEHRDNVYNHTPAYVVTLNPRDSSLLQLSAMADNGTDPTVQQVSSEPYLYWG